ncbi:MAG: formylmethanofuran dehydrogenase subunit C [Mariniblastus sp.]|nr:formylmethanofuran dehydrogenase subunit C [Mariniblastus sp.]
MALVLCQQVETQIPIEVEGITPERLLGKSNLEIGQTKILYGRDEVELGELFSIAGALNASRHLVFDGNLGCVQGIGAGQSSGTIEIETDSGRHVGSQMSGGQISSKASVSDFLGIEMTGGVIKVKGNAGDGVGGHFPGSKFGMNRGSILIGGNVGNGLGQAMRRGTIAVGGTAGELTGWNMLAGTIMVFGASGIDAGAGMKRGTIVLAGGLKSQLSPTFVRGGFYPVPILNMLAGWLEQNNFFADVSSLRSSFQAFNGDLLNGGRGEIFVAERSSH